MSWFLPEALETGPLAPLPLGGIGVQDRPPYKENLARVTFSHLPDTRFRAWNDSVAQPDSVTCIAAGPKGSQSQAGANPLKTSRSMLTRSGVRLPQGLMIRTIASAPGPTKNIPNPSS